MSSQSGNDASATRKRALRRLAREQETAYRKHYTALRPAATSSHTARGQAWTRLRHDFPDRYVELYIEERSTGPADAPPNIRTKAWQRASSLLSDLTAVEYHRLLDRARAEGFNEAAAYARAVSQLRNSHTELFAQILSSEIEMWLANETDECASLPIANP